jgi:hypothetical protein
MSENLLTDEEVKKQFTENGKQSGFLHPYFGEPAYLLCKCGAVTSIREFLGAISCRACFALLVPGSTDS